MTLHEAIRTKGGQQAASLEKHLNAAGLNDWHDLTKARLNDFREYLDETVARSSAHTYLAVLRSILSRFEDEIDLPCKGFREVLKIKNERPHKTYLSQEEIERLERVEVRNDSEQYVLDEFLIGAYTGMRVSDSREVSIENVKDGYLTYVSLKTGVRATIPVSERTVERIERVRGTHMEMYLATYNDILRRLAERAGINEQTKVVKAGKHLCEPKFRLISSHTARISFCTNLARLKVPLLDISRLAGHTNTAMTERYIIPTQVELNETAMAYFGK